MPRIDRILTPLVWLFLFCAAFLASPLAAQQPGGGEEKAGKQEPAARGAERGGPDDGPGGPGPGRRGPGGPGGRGPGGVGGGAPQPGQLLPPFFQEMLKLTAEQKRQLEDLQKEVDGKLAMILTAEQKKQLAEMRDRGPGGFRSGDVEADRRAEEAAGGPAEGSRWQAGDDPHRRAEEAARRDAGPRPGRIPIWRC